MARCCPWLALLVLSGVCGCSKPLDSDECSQLMDHYTELLARSQNPEISLEELMRVKGQARARASDNGELSRCSSEVSRSKWECAMKAPSVDEVERCLL